MVQQLRLDLEDRIRRLHDDSGISYRHIADSHNLPDKDATMLHNIVSGKQVSSRNIRRIARALGVPEHRRPYTPRPVTTKEQEQRRAALDVAWRDVIEAGLAALEQEGAG